MKQAIISFSENMSSGYSHTREIAVAFYLDMPQKILRFYSMPKTAGKAKSEISFTIHNHPKFDQLRSMLEAWEADGIEANTVKSFASLDDWNRWRKKVYFRDYEIHWQIFLELEDGAWMVYLNFDPAFPKELESLYRLAKSMKP